MEKTLRPNEAEVKFLNMAYNKFYDIFEEAINDEFWEKEPYYRLSRLKTAFSIYGEILNYEPIKWVIKAIKEKRPPMESEIGSELFKFIRNIFAHFPFFDCWDDVYINSEIVNWYKKGLTIDKFLKKYAGKQEVKYRFWEADKKRMTYLTIAFPPKYDKDNNIYLKDMLSEKEGAKFSLIMMKKIMDTQVLEMN
ncbi:hypothetical protein ABET51_12865 [Metabacillus fastidiosus]|uniref:hypothetical protein n=1 Tax=Metabacillus fastidiosus TaxID=1458 RepID=UPI003D2B7029